MKLVNFTKFGSQPFRLPYDEASDAAAAAKAAEAKAAEIKTATDSLKAAGKLVLTQDEINSMMAENRRKLTQQNTELVTQLETLRSQSNLTQQQKDDLEVRINTLESQYLSKDEIAKRESAKKAKEFEDEKKRIIQEASSWKERYTSETTKRSLLDAAVEGKAVNPEQLVEMLASRTHLGEIVGDDGKPTGKYASLITFNDVNSEGQAVQLELTPQQVIKRMKEMPERFGNLFTATGSGGVGGVGNVGVFKPAPTIDSLKDLDNYKKFRKENPDLNLDKARKLP